MGCGPDTSYNQLEQDGYVRQQFNSYQECRIHYKDLASNMADDPCDDDDDGYKKSYYGPYTKYSSSGSTSYVGYSGGVASSTSTIRSSKGNYGSYKLPQVVSRGGFTSSGRASGSIGG